MQEGVERRRTTWRKFDATTRTHHVAVDGDESPPNVLRLGDIRGIFPARDIRGIFVVY